MAKVKNEKKLIANNKKAWHDYFIDQTYEVGIVLTGTEIKSIRNGKASIKESYAHFDKAGELWVHGMHISPYEQGNRYNVDPLRKRKLLLHKRELYKIEGMTKERGVTIIPLQLYIDKNGRCKVEIGICRGKKLYDKRDAIAKRDAKREMDRRMKERY